MRDKDVEKFVECALARIAEFQLKNYPVATCVTRAIAEALAEVEAEALAEAEAEERQAQPTPRLRFEGPPCDPHFEVNPPEQPAALPPTPKSYWR